MNVNMAPPITEHSAHVLSYAAGIIDGEGTITLMRQGYRCEHPVMIPHISVTSTHLPLLCFFQNTFGGTIHGPSRALVLQGAGRWKRSMAWRFYGAKNIRILLEHLMPYLIIKKPQAQLVMRFICDAEEINRYTHRLSTQEVARRQAIKEEMLILNAKGRTTEHVRLPGHITPVLSLPEKEQEPLWAYFCALLDGEGSFAMPRRQCGLGGRKERLRDSYLCPFIMVSSTTIPVLIFIKEVFGGKIYVYPEKNKVSQGHRNCGYWYENRANRIKQLLVRCLPYFIVKEAQANVLIEFVTGTVRAGRGLGPGELERREILKERLTVLNRKGQP